MPALDAVFALSDSLATLLDFFARGAAVGSADLADSISATPAVALGEFTD